MLDNIINFSIKNKFLIGLMTIGLVIWGLWSASKIPIDAQPDITNNQVQIITLTPSLAGQEVEQLITFPIEQSIVNLPDIQEIRSISRFGLSVVSVVFRDNVDIYFARQLVSEKLREAEEAIPEGIGTPQLGPVSTGLGEVYQYILRPKPGSASKYTPMELRTMQDWIVARQLYGTPGIAEVNSFGGQLKQYEVSLDPRRLKAMDIGITEVFSALEQNNQNTGGAYIEKNPNAYFIRGIGLITSLEDVGNIVVRSGGSTPVCIKDIATVQLGHAIRYGAMTYNGESETVGGIVMMLKGGNSAEVVRRIKEKIPVIQQSLPEDVLIVPYLDRTELVGRTIRTVEKNLIGGALIVIFVLILFLGNLRAGLIVASAIPLSMLFALGMMQLFGISANLMSLGAIDFGLIIDGSLIVVEATMHHLGLRKSARRLSQAEMDQQVYESARKIRTSAAFGEIIILIVYIPILTLTGIEGKMFTPMAQTVSFAILGALILSFTYIPMMSALCLSKKPGTRKHLSQRLMKYLQGIYRPLLVKALRIKYLVLACCLGLFTISIFIISRTGGEFLPTLGEGDFAFHCILPQGTSLTQSVETSMQASRIIKEFQEVKMVIGKTGTAEVPTDPMPPEATDLIIVLKPRDAWKTQKSYAQLSDEMMEALSVIPGVFFEASQPIQMRFNELMTGIRQDVAVKIFGEDLDSLVYYADQVAGVIAQVEGISLPQVERVTGLPQINIEYDRVRMANYGVHIAEVNDVVRTAFAGRKAGVVYENERQFDLVVRLEEARRHSIEEVRNLFIPIPEGGQIPLSQIADVDYRLGPAQISREDGKRMIYIGFNAEGRDVGSIVSEIKHLLKQQVKLPVGYYFTYGGQFENLQKAKDKLLLAVPAALLLIFILLYFTFHSMKEALLVFTAIPMSAIGGVFALALRGMPFSISAGVGFIALFGVAVLNGIVLIATFNRLEKEGCKAIIPRILKGASMRLRPVLMTASVASLGFLPMAISTSAGAEVQKPLATVVIGGLITATALTLFLLPILYHMFMKKNPNPVRTSPRRSGNNPAVWGILLGLCLLPGIMHAQEISAERAVAIALDNHPGIRAGQLEVRAAARLKNAAFELPETQVTYQFGNTEGFEYNNGIQVAQSIPFPTLFGHKRRLASARAQASSWSQVQRVNALKKDVRSQYHKLEYLNEKARVLQALDSVYADFVRIARLRYETGDAGKLDVSAALTEKGAVALQIRRNAVSTATAYKRLKSLMQYAGDFSLPSGPYQPLTLPVVSADTIPAGNPRVQGILQAAKIAEEEKKVERAENLPGLFFAYNNISSVGMHTRQGKEQFYGRDQRFSFFDLGLTIPLNFGAGRARIRALEEQQEALELQAGWAQEELTTELEAHLQQYALNLSACRYYKEDALPNGEKVAAAARLGYEVGETDYVAYLDALEMLAEIKLNYIKTIYDVNQTVTQIYALLNQ